MNLCTINPRVIPSHKCCEVNTFIQLYPYPITLSHPSPHPTTLYLTTSFSLINVVRDTTYTPNVSNSISTSVSKEFWPANWPQIYNNSPTIFGDPYLVKIPKKVYHTLKHFTPKKKLKAIHNDLQVAIESCLLFVSQLSSTYFEWKNGDNPDGWKSLYSKYLRELVYIEPDTYLRVREALETPLLEGSVIECDYTSEKGSKCFWYRLGSSFIGKGIMEVRLESTIVKQLAKENHERKLMLSMRNEICKNLLQFYTQVTLPSKDEVLEKSKQLIKKGFHTKKGKKLCLLNKKTRKEADDLSYVEDGIEIFSYLTANGLMVPTIGSEASGGRIVDSFTLMPGYIRNMVRVNGHPIAECDFTCFHPNIAITLYGGNEKFITHQKLSSEAKIELATVKREHLSFFNKHPKEMKKSPLYSYYSKKEPQMMENIIKEKYRSRKNYKITSQRLMTKEVEIMTDIIKQLSQEGIYVGYIYDAIFCIPDHAQRVKQVMDEQVIKHGVFTKAKITMP